MKMYMYVALVIITIITLYMTIPLTSPALLTSVISLTRPESSIRRDMLRITPIGTHKEDVIKVIEEREWRVGFIRDTSGYFLQRGGRVSDGSGVEVGTQSIRIFLGRVLRGIDVDVYYAFDEDSKLIDIAIRRELDLI